ncbi:MAG: hypothetical protein AB7I41_08075 [Candidatus Sericytochromatia bacterium]
MQKNQISLLSLCLFTVLACQPVSQIAPTPAKLSPEAYAQQISNLYKDFGKSNLEGVKANPLALSFAMNSGGRSISGLPTSSVSAPSTGSPNLLTPQLGFNSTPAPSSPVSSAPTTVSPEAESSRNALLNSLADVYKVSLQANLKALQQMKSKLSSITPPAEVQAKHSLLLSYFSQSETLFQSLQKEVEFSDSSTFSKQMNDFYTRNQAQFAKIEAMTAEVQTILVGFKLDGLRAESRSKQQGSVLTAVDYKAKAKAIFAKAGTIGSSFLSPMPALSAQSPLPNPSEQPKDPISRIKYMNAESLAVVEAFVALHPPDELQTAHLGIYAYLKDGQALQSRMGEWVIKMLEKDPKVLENPQTLMLGLYTDTDLLQLTMDFYLLASSLSKYMAELN